MPTETKARAAIAALISSMTNAVIFGTSLVVMATSPTLRGAEAMPMVVVASLILVAPAAWLIAPHLRAGHWRLRAAERSPTTVQPRI